jgi:hypothetical protein
MTLLRSGYPPAARVAPGPGDLGGDPAPARALPLRPLLPDATGGAGREPERDPRTAAAGPSLSRRPRIRGGGAARWTSSASPTSTAGRRFWAPAAGSGRPRAGSSARGCGGTEGGVDVQVAAPSAGARLPRPLARTRSPHGRICVERRGGGGGGAPPGSGVRSKLLRPPRAVLSPVTAADACAVGG